jgi:hypothetical protein
MTTPNEIPTECAWTQDQLEVHSLGATSEAERDRIESHLLICPECRELADPYDNLLPLLGLAAAQHFPSASVRLSVLAAARADVSKVPEPATARTPTRVAPWYRAPLQRMRLPHVLSAPLIGLLVLSGAVTVGSQYQLGTQRDRMEALERENAGLSTHLDSVRQGQVRFGQNATVYSLGSVDSSSDAAGFVLGSPEQALALISVWNMPARAQTYQAVLEMDSGQFLVVGSLAIDESGVGSAQVTLPGPLAQYNAVHIMSAQSAELSASTLAGNDVLLGGLQQATSVPTIES